MLFNFGLTIFGEVGGGVSLLPGIANLGFISGHNFLTLLSECRYFGKCMVCQMKLACTKTVNTDYPFQLSVTCRPTTLFPGPFPLKLGKRPRERGWSANIRPTCSQHITDSLLTVFN